MTTEHLRPLLNDAHTTNLFFRVGKKLCRGDVPQSVVQMVRQGRMTALAKPDGGVRGIVAGDVIRRLVAKTMAQQLGDAVEAFTAPYQYALRTKAGCECVAHVLQGLTELDPLATVTSVDGISAFDLISRKAMLEGLMRVDGGSSALPFVRLFYGSPSEYLWEDATGTVHTILGHPDFVRQHLRDVSEGHERFLTRIPLVRDVQSAWLLLLHCAQARANFLLRAVRPEAVEEFATRHDRGLWWCLARFWESILSSARLGCRRQQHFPSCSGV